MFTESASSFDSGSAGAGFMEYLPLILDIVLILFLLIVAIVGCKKGFLRGLVGLIGTIVAFVIAILCAAPVAEFVENAFGMTSGIAENLEGSLSDIDAFNVPMSDEGLTAALAELGLPGFLTDMILDVVAGLQIEGSPTVAQVVAPALAQMLAIAICGVVLFVVAAIVLNLLAGFLSKVLDKIPVVGAINHILGLALGLVKGLIVVYIILAVLSLLPVQSVQDTLAQTTVINWLLQNNLIMLAVEQISALQPVVEYVQGFIGGLTGGGENTVTAMGVMAGLPL